MLVVPIPYWDMYVPVNVNGETVPYLLCDFQGAFMWIRMYNLIRTMFTHTIYMDAYAKKICN